MNLSFRNKNYICVTGLFSILLCSALVYVYYGIHTYSRDMEMIEPKVFENTIDPVQQKTLLDLDIPPNIPAIVPPIQPNLTVVTAYFNIGNYHKGHPKGRLYNSNTYNQWANTFGYLLNALVIYTDSEDFRDQMSTIRKHYLKQTKIIIVNRSELWAFQNNGVIKEIFNTKSYPKHYPNTVVSEYSCAMHAKLNVVALAAKADFFKTKYYMWLDIGYFRDRKSERPFFLTKPNNFNETRIAMNLVYPNHPLTYLPEYIFKNNLVLVGGGLFFGDKNQIMIFADQFKRAVDYYLKKGWINTDQQVIYAMFSKEGRKNIQPTVDLQLYRSPKDYDWFYLGTSMIIEL